MNKKLIATLVLSSVAASAFTMSAGAAADKQVLKNEKGAVHTITGKLGKVEGKTAEAKALNALDKVKDVYGFAKASENFKLKSSHQDENGVTHTKLDQTINGIPVYGEQVIVHEAAGDVKGISGTFTKLVPNADQWVISSEDGEQLAVAHTGFTGELVKPAVAELTYLPREGGQALLTYKVNVEYLGAEEAGNWLIFVDARNGSIVQSYNELAEATGTGVGVLGDTKTLNTTYKNGTYYLEDQTKYMYQTNGTSILTLDFRNGKSNQYYMTDADNKWDATTQRAGVDAHYYAGKTYDWYLAAVGRNSIDNNGMQIVSGVRYGRSYNNAFWTGSQMVYGDGDGTTFIAFSGALDVIAHELTHGVTDYTSALVYQNQSGALNESWSDAIAAVVEGKNWDIGEDVYTPAIAGDALRSMADPTRYGDPAHMNQYVNTTSDNGGVHTNSGIPNKAFYNFATSIGSREIAGKIWYTAARDYMTANTDFSGARAATIQAATALYGASSAYVSACANAWSAVGIN